MSPDDSRQREQIAFRHFIRSPSFILQTLITLSNTFIVVTLHKRYVSDVTQYIGPGLRVLPLDLSRFLGDAIEVGILKLVDIASDFLEPLFQPFALVLRSLFKVLRHILRQLVKEVLQCDKEHFQVFSGCYRVRHGSVLEKGNFIPYPFLLGDQSQLVRVSRHRKVRLVLEEVFQKQWLGACFRQESVGYRHFRACYLAFTLFKQIHIGYSRTFLD